MSVAAYPTMSPRTVSLRQARTDYLSYKRRNNKDSTVRYYESVLRGFIQYCEEEHTVTHVNEIDGYLIQQWQIYRQQEDNVAPITLKNNTKHLIVFLKWCASSELLPPDLPGKVDVPNVSKEDTRSDETVDKQRVDKILDYLELYEYASRLHAAVKVLWHTGCRISALIALDLRDMDPLEGILKFRNRRDSGTALKNGAKSERNVTVDSETMDVLVAYKRMKRPEVNDDEGRNPLFTTKNGRVNRQSVYKDFVGVSRPCVYTEECPHNRDLDECEATKKAKAFGCPSSKALHPIRRGSITYHLKQDWPVEKVSQRCDVSVSVLEDHYDVRTEEEKRAGRADLVDKL